MPPAKFNELGLHGVNVDKDPLEMGDNELRQAQNAIHDPLGVNAGLHKRPGLYAFNTNVAAGAIKGGIGVPLPDLGGGGSSGAVHFIYIGRGGVAT